MKYLMTRWQRKGIAHVEKAIIVKIVLYLLVAIATFTIGNMLNRGNLEPLIAVFAFACGALVGLAFGALLGQVKWHEEQQRAFGVKNCITRIALVLYLVLIIAFIVFRNPALSFWLDAGQTRIVTMFAICGLMLGNVTMLRTRLIRLMRIKICQDE